MAILLTRNFSEAEGPVVPPLRPDGGMWAWCMYFNSMWDVAYADTLTELVGVLVDGYQEADLLERDVLRISYAIRAVQVAQGSVVGTLVDESVLSAEELAVLMSPKWKPHDTPVVWVSPVPLFIMSTNYSPYTDVEPPTIEGQGLVVEVDATEEHGFLYGLAAVGVIKLMSSN